MLTLLEAPDDVIAMRIEGDLDQADIDRVMDRVEASIAARDKTHMFAEVASLDDVHLRDLGGYARRAMALLGKLERFGRIALVSDKAWLRWAARIESALLPHVSYETFTSDQRDLAFAWVKGERALPHGAALKIIETDRPDVLGFEIDGKLGAAETRAAAAYFRAALGGGGKLRLFGRIRRIGGVELSGLFDGDYLAMKRDYLGRVDRYALVGAPAWMRAWTAAIGPIAGTDFRFFEPDDEDEAWAWLGARPTAERPAVA